MWAIVNTPWLTMWLIALAVFLSCKALSTHAVPNASSWSVRLGYWFAWPGLDAERFLRYRSRDPRPAMIEWCSAILKTFFGAMLFWFGGLALPVEHDLVRGWLGMIGVVFVLHFGLFHVLSCCWRTFGRDAPPLMDHPWAATSVGDFWGRRWNRAFRDITHRFLFRPLAHTVSPRFALLLGFVISGLLHEAVITVPAGGGYGGPTMYFCVQALGVALEHSSLAHWFGLKQRWGGRLFAVLIVLAPVAWLFPPVFIRNVVVPMMDAFGAA